MVEGLKVEGLKVKSCDGSDALMDSGCGSIAFTSRLDRGMTMNNESHSGGTVRSFEDLRIWQQARLLVRHVYSDFTGDPTAARDFGFRRQIQEAAVSIMNNIAEGFERRTDGGFARFLDIAKGSSGEVRSMYYVA